MRRRRLGRVDRRVPGRLAGPLRAAARPGGSLRGGSAGPGRREEAPRAGSARAAPGRALFRCSRRSLGSPEDKVGLARAARNESNDASPAGRVSGPRGHLSTARAAPSRRNPGARLATPAAQGRGIPVAARRARTDDPRRLHHGQAGRRRSDRRAPVDRPGRARARWSCWRRGAGRARPCGAGRGPNGSSTPAGCASPRWPGATWSGTSRSRARWWRRCTPRCTAPPPASSPWRSRRGPRSARASTLARVDSPELTSRLVQEQATLASLESELGRQRIAARQAAVRAKQAVDLLALKRDAAVRTLKRERSLHERGMQSPVEYEKAEDDAQIAAVELENARETVTLERDTFGVRGADAAPAGRPAAGGGRRLRAAGGRADPARALRRHGGHRGGAGPGRRGPRTRRCSRW